MQGRLDRRNVPPQTGSDLRRRVLGAALAIYQAWARCAAPQLVSVPPLPHDGGASLLSG